MPGCIFGDDWQINDHVRWAGIGGELDGNGIGIAHLITACQRGDSDRIDHWAGQVSRFHRIGERTTSGSFVTHVSFV